MTAHNCRPVLIPVPAHMPEARAAAHDGYGEGSPEFGRDSEGRICFAIDSCLVPALQAVWASGYKTLSCCCGHGQEAGGIIVLDTGTFSAEPRTRTQEMYAAAHKNGAQRCEPGAVTDAVAPGPKPTNRTTPVKVPDSILWGFIARRGDDRA